MNSQLDLNNIPKLIGKECKQQASEIYNVLVNTNFPIYLIGPSGSSKTITAMNLAKKYSIQYKVPAYYVQLSPELTKTSLILGLRLVNGSLIPVDGVVSECMQNGGIIIVDEATHGTQELLLMFNSILDRTAVTSVGDKIVYAKDTFKVIFCSNKSSYAGNVRLPQSFAQRLVSFYFNYPTFENECEIAKSITSSECKKTLNIPECVVKYVVNTMRKVRTEEYPLSARNMSMALSLLNLQPITKQNSIDQYFISGQNVEAIRTNIAEKIFNTQVIGNDMLVDPEIVEFTQFVSNITIYKFKEIMLNSMLYYLDIEGTELVENSIKQTIETGII
jgi:hypothetical protein